MQPNTLVLISTAVVAMFFGYFFGLFEGRGQGYKKRQKEEETETGARLETTESDSVNMPENPKESPAVTAPPEPSLLRLSQDGKGGYQLDLDNERVDTSALTPAQRQRLIALLTAMRPWLTGGKSTPAAPASKPAPAPATISSPVVKPILQGPQIQAADEEPESTPLSMVTQIDTILQARLSGTPLQDVGISLRESPEGGVQVWVGLNRYQGVDAVPDEEIKAAIKAAIAEWENRFTPGD